MKKILLIISVVIFFAACREKYDANINSPHTGFLVVEGFINSGNERTTITLSRTLRLIDSVYYKPEQRAQVSVEGDNNDRFQLTEISPGIYRSAQPLVLNNSAKYRVKILAQGSEFVSEYSPVARTPAIDSISWKRENDGVQLYVHTHDDKTNEKSYFRWQYDETWEINSMYPTNLKVIVNPDKSLKVVYRFPDHAFDFSLFYCWQNFSSTNLLLGSTEKLSKNQIYLPVAFIEPGSIKLGVMYSINLKQYGMSKRAYDFYLQMKKNTEQLGTIFDPQPSELNSNITNLTNPSEVVVGFVEVNDMQSKRIFISRSQVPDWRYSRYCPEIVVPNISDSIQYYSNYLPNIPNEPKEELIPSYFAAPPDCVDCTTRGTNVRPPFWPK